MTAQSNFVSRLRAALGALAGNAPEDLRNRVASLELDLRQKNDEIAALREEYERLREQGERERDSAASAAFDALARRLAPLLAQLATMESMAASERAPRLEDVFKLFDMLEKALAGEGLERIGAVGEEAIFDARWHQRIGGAEVDDGDRVRVRFVGYRIGDNVLLKAMVSRAVPKENSGENSEATA
jgi:molecular chaperone GrpE (heat shock protein)